MPKPSILLIPGSFALPEFYDPVMNAIAAKGYSIRGLHLLAVGLKTGPREGSPPAMTKRLSKAERQAQGKKGGIIRLGYMAAVVPALGVSAQGLLADLPSENQASMKADERGRLYLNPISVSAAFTFSDLPVAEGEAWVRKFPQHSAVSFTNKLTHAGYKDMPVSYLFCEGDLCITPALQRKGIATMEEASGRKVDVTSIKSDHVPPVSHPELVVDWILDVATKAESG
ncbi:hypothetical protein ACEPPN_014103 [Leptodophora sp. 'Broadleaf-Isolate-01']